MGHRGNSVAVSVRHLLFRQRSTGVLTGTPFDHTVGARAILPILGNGIPVSNISGPCLGENVSAGHSTITVQYPGIDREPPLHEIDVGAAARPLVTEPPPRALDAVSYAAELVAGVPGPAVRPVELVVAQCMSTSIGVEVARLLTVRGHRPVLVALDGAPCAAHHVAGVYRETLAHYRRAGRDHDVTAEALAADPAALLAGIHEELTSAATEALSAATADPALAAELAEETVEVSMGWLTHLVAAHNAPVEPWRGRTVVVTSSDSPFPGPWPAVPDPVVVPVDRGPTELIGSPAVRDVLVAELAARAGGVR
jgi:hypothetical protein